MGDDRPFISPSQMTRIPGSGPIAASKPGRPAGKPKRPKTPTSGYRSTAHTNAGTDKRGSLSNRTSTSAQKQGQSPSKRRKGVQATLPPKPKKRKVDTLVQEARTGSVAPPSRKPKSGSLPKPKGVRTKVRKGVTVKRGASASPSKGKRKGPTKGRKRPANLTVSYGRTKKKRMGSR
jgi:hypothetical protein